MNIVSIFLLVLLSSASAHKILVYNSKYGHSHTNFLARIADILAEAGHNVTSLMPNMDPNVRDTTKLSKIIHVERSAATASMYEEFMVVLSDLFAANMLDPFLNYRAENYDVMFAEHFDSCGISLIELIKPKAFIAVATGAVFGSHQGADLGLPAAHSYNPAMYLSRFDVHSMWGRLLNLHAEWTGSLLIGTIRNHIDTLFQEKFGSKYPSKILSRSAYVFVNSEPLLDFASPTIAKVVFIPGIGVQEPKTLDETWEKLLTKRPRTVLLSFGSMVKSIYLPIDVRMAIAQAMNAFPDTTFIWKYEEEDDFTKNVGSKLDNLVLTKWMPQVDILNHKNLRVFMTHGGMGSTQETATRGVPGIFVPVFAEQPRNAGMMEFNGLGKVLNKFELSNATKIIEVIQEVLDNPVYFENAQKIAAMLRSKPFTSKEQLIKYTEFAAEFGPSAALRPQSHDMNWVKYNNVDIIIVAALVVMICMLTAIKLILLVVSGCSISVKRKTMNCFAFIVFLLVSSTRAYKILVYNSKFGHSHTNFMARIADILAEEGHEVTSLMPIIDLSVRDVTVKSKIVHVERSSSTAVLYDGFVALLSDMFTATLADPRVNYRNGQFMGRIFSSQCRAVLDEQGLIERLQETRFDVMFAEPFDMCGVALVGLVKPKSFIAVATGAFFGAAQQEDFGIPTAQSYNPGMFLSRLNVHSMLDRAWNLYAEWGWSLFHCSIRNHIDALFREKHGSDFPSVRELLSRSAYVLANSEPLIDFATPTISKVIYIPGIAAYQPAKLDKDWEKLLTKRPRTVLLSFGSMVKSIYLPIEVRMAIAELLCKTVQAFPDITFIWKYEDNDNFTENVGSKIDNLVLTKWMPQVDILNHKNVRAFVTHGGMGSTQETAMRGVPGIFVPIFAEQPRNAGMMEYNGLGKVISKFEMANASKIIEIVRKVLDNPMYYQNSQRTAAMLQTKPFTSREQLVKYTDFAAKFGPSAALRPQSHDMNWMEYHNVDIIVVAFLMILAIGLFAIKMIFLVVSGCSISSKIKKE